MQEDGLHALNLFLCQTQLDEYILRLWRERSEVREVEVRRQRGGGHRSGRWRLEVRVAEVTGQLLDATGAVSSGVGQESGAEVSGEE